MAQKKLLLLLISLLFVSTKVVADEKFEFKAEDLDYAKDVLVKMIKKSKKKIGIFDVNNKTKEGSYHQIRMGDMDKQEYKEKYKGLDHLFYEKIWFKEIAKEFNLKISMFDQTFENYSNSSLRFNVIMEKR